MHHQMTLLFCIWESFAPSSLVLPCLLYALGSEDWSTELEEAKLMSLVHWKHSPSSCFMLVLQSWYLHFWWSLSLQPLQRMYHSKLNWLTSDQRLKKIPYGLIKMMQHKWLLKFQRSISNSKRIWWKNRQLNYVLFKFCVWNFLLILLWVGLYIDLACNFACYGSCWYCDGNFNVRWLNRKDEIICLKRWLCWVSTLGYSSCPYLWLRGIRT